MNLPVRVLVVLSFVPIVVNLIAVWFLLPNSVPLHVGFDGVVDRYGSKFATFVIGGLLTGFSLLFSLFYAKAESLNALGLIRGTSVRGVGRDISFPLLSFFKDVCCIVLALAVV